jgi:hypothetical protein
VLDDGSQWLKTALLGLGAGVVASLLFIASQLVTSSTALQDKGVKTLVVLVTVVGFIAGITFDAVYKKLRQQDVVDNGRSTGPEAAVVIPTPGQQRPSIYSTRIPRPAWHVPGWTRSVSRPTLARVTE